MLDTYKLSGLILIGLYFCTQVHFTNGLECYVCLNQTGNSEKCLNTIQTCSPGDDVCFTEIRWGSKPYFSEGAEKQFYVSKRCMAKNICQKLRKRYMQYCTHIWYEDWTCSDCCQGDRCNYFIVSGTPKISSIYIGLIISAVIFVNKIL